MTAPEVSRYYLMRCPDTLDTEDGTLFSVKLTGSAEEAGSLPDQLEDVECLRCGRQHTAKEVSQEVYEDAIPDDEDELDEVELVPVDEPLCIMEREDAGSERG